MRISSLTSAKTVVWTKNPLSPHLSPPHLSVAPSFLPDSINSMILVRCFSLTCKNNAPISAFVKLDQVSVMSEPVDPVRPLQTGCRFFAFAPIAWPSRRRHRKSIREQKCAFQRNSIGPCWWKRHRSTFWRPRRLQGKIMSWSESVKSKTFITINVRENDDGALATKFQRHALQIAFGSCFHNEFAHLHVVK